MHQSIRIGLIGCGGAFRHYMVVAERLRRRGIAKVVAACDVAEEKRKYVSQEYGITTFSTDYREIIHSDAVDLVLVLTWDLSHGNITRAALEAGKHVLVEKPMTLVLDHAGRKVDLDKTLSEATHLIELVKKGSGFLICAPFVILSDTYQAIWKRLNQGEIGNVFSARARYGYSMHSNITSSGYEWVYSPGGGPLFNIAIYNLTTLTGLLGPVKKVMAMTGVATPELKVDGKAVLFDAEEDNAQIILDFGNNAFASVTTGWTIQRYRSPAIELYGTRGTLQMLGDDWAPDGYELWLNEVGAWQIFPETNPSWSWADGLRYFVDCIHNETPPTAMLEHALHVLEIILQVKASARDGQAKEVESTFPYHRSYEIKAPVKSSGHPL